LYDEGANNPTLSTFHQSLQIPKIKVVILSFDYISFYVIHVYLVSKMIKSTDGKVDLYCMSFLPPEDKYGSKGPFPAIVSVYGGPHVQRVYHLWNMT
jgi:hypothetical protein